MKSILKYGLVLLLWQAVALEAAVTVTNIAAGETHSLFITSDGSLWGMGYNVDGQLGDGTYIFSINRFELITVSNAVSIAAGVSHSLLLKSDGSLWSMGNNAYGQLGDGTYSNTNRPKQIVASNVVAIAAGGSHSLFLKSDSSLWTMGRNNNGQLGDGTFSNTNKPELIISNGVTAIAAGELHSLFFKTDGSLWTMGYNGYGQLGDGTANTKTNLPEQIVSSDVVAVTSGRYHSLFLKSDGSLWTMGRNNSGQLGDGTANSQTNLPEQIVASGVSAIAGGYAYSLFLKTNGSLWAMGRNANGQFFFDGGSFISTNRPQQIVSNGVTAIASGGFHSLFLKSDGSLWVIGNNYGGQLGDGFANGSTLPEQIYPSPQSVLTNSISSTTNLQFNATCQFGGTFYLLAATNLNQALNQWTPVATNIINDRTNNFFKATLTNAVNTSTKQKFYILQSQ